MEFLLVSVELASERRRDAAIINIKDCHMDVMVLWGMG